MTGPYLRFVGQSLDERSILRSRPFLASNRYPDTTSLATKPFGVAWNLYLSASRKFDSCQLCKWSNRSGAFR